MSLCACSFCGKHPPDVEIVVGPIVAICEECTEEASRIFFERRVAAIQQLIPTLHETIMQVRP